MGQVLNDLLRNFSGGVVTSRASDELEINESPRGRNSALYLVAGQKALVRKRKGASTVNSAPVSGSPAIIGQYAYRKFAIGGTYTLYHLLVGNNGRLDVLDPGGTAAAADAANPTPFTAGDYIPDFATANNLAFIVNSNGDAKKFDGTTVQNFGITRPTVGPMALADAGTSGAHDGTYEGRVTYYNANTGQESSASDTTTATVTVSNKTISWTNIPVSTDPQVTARRLYIRNTTTMANFYLAKEIADNVSTSTTTSVSDPALVILGPDAVENDPPPADVRYIESHLSRLFVSDGVALYYSHVGFPEAFDPDFVEAVNANDSDQITGLHSAHDVLLIFKRTQLYALFGDDPSGWSIRLISADVGCVSHRSIRTIEGITYWWSLKGPMAWDGVGLPKPIGTPLISETISTSALNFAQFDKICAEVDQTNQRVMFAVPSLNATRNDIMLPFNYRLTRWESDRWDPFDVASMIAIEDADKVPWVHIGGYDGQVFKWWNAGNDGVPAGTTTHGTITDFTSTTLTDDDATFATAGGKLIGRYVYILDPANTSVQRLRIVSNTATVLTVDAAVEIQGDPTGFTYVLGAPQFSWDTPWMDGGLPFHKKRYEYLYTQAYSQSGAAVVKVDLFLDNNEFEPARTDTLTTQSNNALWDESLWDQSTWGFPSTVQLRTRVAKTSKLWRVRYYNLMPDQDVVLTKIGMRAELLTDKS